MHNPSRSPAAPVTLQDRLEALPRRIITGDADRPDLSVWPDMADKRTPNVILYVGPFGGNPMRFVELSPGQARQLGNYLIRCADEVCHVAGQVAASEVKAAGFDALTAALAQVTATFAERA